MIKMRKRVITLLPVIFLLLAGCFSSWQGETNMGTFSINIGGGAGRSALPWNSDINIESLTHTIKLNGGPGPDESKTITGNGKVNFVVVSGDWDISIEARFDGELAAVGFATVNIKPGPNGAVSIQMRQPDSDSTEEPPDNGGAEEPPDNGGAEEPPDNGGAEEPPDNGGAEEPPDGVLDTIEITIERILDQAPVLTGGTISRGGPNNSITLVLANPELYSWFLWSLNRVGVFAADMGPITSDESSFVVDATNIEYNTLGGHYVFLDLEIDGMRYSTSILIEIVE